MSVEDGRALRSDVIPFTWRLIERQRQPAIEVAHDDGVQRWVVSGDEI